MLLYNNYNFTGEELFVAYVVTSDSSYINMFSLLGNEFGLMFCRGWRHGQIHDVKLYEEYQTLPRGRT